MKKIIVTFVFVFSMMFAMYLPTQAKDNRNSSNPVTGKTLTVAYGGGVRYMRVRGKRYKVNFITYRKRGRLYYRITRIRRA
jgi:hypothetical protein